MFSRPGGRRTEDMEKTPLSLYGITKLAGEQIVNNSECQTVIIRPFTVYGEEGRKDQVFFKWLEQIKSSRPITVYADRSFRGYVYVEDLVNATADLIQNGWNKYHEDFNLGGSEIVYLKDVLKVFVENFSDDDSLKIEHSERPKEDIFRQCADTSKAKEILGFNPKPKFIENLQNIINNFKKQNE